MSLKFRYGDAKTLKNIFKALNMFFLSSKMIASRGVIVILTASTEGRGFHSLEGQTGSFGGALRWRTRSNKFGHATQV